MRLAAGGSFLEAVPCMTACMYLHVSPVDWEGPAGLVSTAEGGGGLGRAFGSCISLDARAAVVVIGYTATTWCLTGQQSHYVCCYCWN